MQHGGFACLNALCTHWSASLPCGAAEHSFLCDGPHASSSCCLRLRASLCERQHAQADTALPALCCSWTVPPLHRLCVPLGIPLPGDPQLEGELGKRGMYLPWPVGQRGWGSVHLTAECQVSIRTSLCPLQHFLGALTSVFEARSHPPVNL